MAKLSPELSKEFVQEYKDRYDAGDCPIFTSHDGLGYAVYKRTYARPIFAENRTEEWPETIERVINGAVAIGAQLTQSEMRRLFDHMYNLRAFLAGRMLWQLGTENNARLGGDSLVNCWYVTINEPSDFAFLFNELMLGGGVGFGIGNAKAFGRVDMGATAVLDGFDVDLVVPDNREGWAAVVQRTIEANLAGESFTYSVDAIRPEGAPISTFGGTASGPGILVNGIEHIQLIMAKRDGEYLTPVDLLDIGNIIGSIVVSGNVRRSAQIAIGDFNDIEFLQAKNWSVGNIPAWRAMSNNSVLVENPADLTDEFWEGYHGNGEPYGMINLQALREQGRTGELRYDYSIQGVNPCAEIGLASYESCNLAELVLPRMETKRQMQDAAKLLYKVQKAIASMPYLHPNTEEIVHKNMRLGLSVTGVAQATEKQMSWLSPTYELINEFDKWFSAKNDLPESIRLTTVKPSGTLSLVAGVTPGAHPGFSEFHIRRVRMSATDSLVNWCRLRGYSVEWLRDFEGNDDPRTVVVSFPVRMPSDTWFADTATAEEQIDMVLRMQREWSDNAVSITIYYRPEELDYIKQRLVDDWDKIKTISFLPYENHGFDQAPLEAITEDEYTERVNLLRGHEHVHGISSLDILDDECATGACPTR